MMLANFFDKTAMAAGEILKGFDRSSFAARLIGQNIGIICDLSSNGVEANVTLELLVNLLARLYPRIVLAIQPEARRDELIFIARGINPEIEIGDNLGCCTVNIVVGLSSLDLSSPTVFSGSSGWTALLSQKTQVSCGITNNPFGAAGSACLAAANVFRLVFAQELETASDMDVTLSFMNFVSPQKLAPEVDLPVIDLGKFCLVGAGAIGNSLLWCLSKVDCVGEMTIVDGQMVELTNLQRYLLTNQSLVGFKKTAVAQNYFGESKLNVAVDSVSWAEHIAKNGITSYDRVLVAVDSAEVRCEVQASLPRRIQNAWTGEFGDCGISSHRHFGEDACLMCLYLPDKVAKNQDELIAESIGFVQPQPPILMLMRKLLYTGEPLDANFIAMIAQANNIDPAELGQFRGKPLLTFYSEAVCGGLLLRLKDAPQNLAGHSVPLAFQSALAGIMFAAQLVVDTLEPDHAGQTTARLNVLRPVPRVISFPFARDASGNCICTDPDYLEAYDNQYPEMRQTSVAQDG
jgi:hypothetical protein